MTSPSESGDPLRPGVGPVLPAPTRLPVQVQREIVGPQAAGSGEVAGGASPRVRLVTLGAYGYDEAGFFGALQRAGVDTFCDVRYRRGVRGREYAFANRQRLEARLAALGIRYLHCRDLAPSPTLRGRQLDVDRAARVAKRQRAGLSEAFIAGYEAECMAGFNGASFVERLGEGARVVALFCVERVPDACHRSLLAARLGRELGLEVEHLVPE